MLANMRCLYVRRSSTLCVCLFVVAAVGIVWRCPLLFSQEQSATTVLPKRMKTSTSTRRNVKYSGAGSTPRAYAYSSPSGTQNTGSGYAGSNSTAATHVGGGTNSSISGAGGSNNSTSGAGGSKSSSSGAGETFPTSSPTESPAPSPAPSFVPSFSPTGTAKPTNGPTASPTESPAPSPAPSISPSDVPTQTPSQGPTLQPTTTRYPTLLPSISPSQLPTLVPSQFPSLAPTVSSQPSAVPSVLPTNVPSFRPSISMQPSVSPSAFPTSSMQPSSSPTFVGTKTTIFTVTFPTLTQLLTAEQEEAFQVGTEIFIPQAPLEEDSALWQPEVQILQQRLIPVVKTPANERQLQSTNPQLQNTTTTTQNNGNETIKSTTNEEQQGKTLSPSSAPTQAQQMSSSSSPMLSVQFQLVAVYKGSDENFNLYLVLNPLFQEHYPLWIHLLGNYNDLFLQLRPPTSTIPPALVSNSENARADVTVSSAAMAIIVVVIVASVSLGVAAVAVGIREYRLAMIGKELFSPSQGGGSDGVFFVDQQQAAQDMEVISMLPPNDINDDDNGIAQFYPQQIPVQGSESSSYADQPQPTPTHQVNLMYPVVVTAPGQGGGRVVVDPVEYYEPSNENYNMASDPDNRDSLGDIFRGNAVFGRTGSDPPSASSEAGAANLAAYYANNNNNNNQSHHRSALMEDNRRLDASFAGGDAYRERSHELMLTGKKGGTLGAKAFPSTPSEYTASQQSGSYYTNSMASNNYNNGGHRGVGTGSGTLGAKPLMHEDVRLSANPSFDSSLVPRAGLYDVFAPSGPIGIIVDTTKDGPAVHSLKASSPMLGLISPGDLIVALDDKDTRGMTAATLTRLMAKKANQKERKITLLATERY